MPGQPDKKKLARRVKPLMVEIPAAEFVKANEASVSLRS